MEVEIIKHSDSDYGIYDLNGNCVESGFESRREAEGYIYDNGFEDADALYL